MMKKILVALNVLFLSCALFAGPSDGKLKGREIYDSRGKKGHLPAWTPLKIVFKVAVDADPYWVTWEERCTDLTRRLNEYLKEDLLFKKQGSQVAEDLSLFNQELERLGNDLANQIQHWFNIQPTGLRACLCDSQKALLSLLRIWSQLDIEPSEAFPLFLFDNSLLLSDSESFELEFETSESDSSSM